MNKKLFGLLSVLVLVSLVLTACGSPAPVATENVLSTSSRRYRGSRGNGSPC